MPSTHAILSGAFIHHMPDASVINLCLQSVVFLFQCSQGTKWHGTPIATNLANGCYTECSYAYPCPRLVSTTEARNALGIISGDSTYPCRPMGRKNDYTSSSRASGIHGPCASLGRDATATMLCDRTTCRPSRSPPTFCSTNPASFRAWVGAFAEHVGLLSSSLGCSRRVPSCF